jgi:hypothetical protein
VLRARPGTGDSGQRRISIRVASAGAITQFANRVVGLRTLNFQMCVGLITVGVAAGAVWSIGGICPRRLIRIRRMARRASQSHAMIARILRRTMFENEWRPSGCRVTHIALSCRGHMSRRLASCTRTVVACTAAARDTCVVELCRQPCERGVAQVA